jgi:3-oxoacyl-[acyl-carrier protein] reductase
VSAAVPADLRLDGRVAIITGGSAGIGLATAERAEELGARVAVLDLTAAARSSILGIRCDVSNQEEVDKAFARVREELGPVNILVNNAAIGVPGRFVDIVPSSWRRTMSVNIDGVYYCTHAALRQMLPGPGSIVNVSSQAARFRSLACDAAYAATKGALLPFTRQLASELAAERIRVNCVLPGAVDTELPRRNLSETERAAMVAGVPLQRAADPGEVAAVICFLASDAASFVTGAAVDVNGGFI